MRTLILLLLLSNFACGFSQDTLGFTAYVQSEKSIDDNYIPYIVGSESVPGYDVEIRTCRNDESVDLPNGRKIAGLNCILSESETYKNGFLIFNEDTTTILDIRIVPVGKSEAKFIVEGKEFNMSFTLLSGEILAYEDRYCTFNTKGEGIWKIEKK